MSPRIERHEVGAQDLAEATENFTDRIESQVHAQEHFGRTGSGWEEAASLLSVYAGARSVQDPHAETDIEAALHSAAEAQLGSLVLDCAPTDVELSVSLTYTGTGLSYPALAEEDGFGNAPHGELPADPHEWREAMYLAIISGRQETSEGPLVTLASHFEADQVLERALTFYVHPHLGAEREQLQAYVGAALEPFFTSVAQDPDRQSPVLGVVDSDLLLLHTLLSRDEQAFWFAMMSKLEWYRDQERNKAPLHTLLPTPELAFAALAVRVEGWRMPFESDYLPRYLVEGPGDEEQRVGPYGADKAPEAVRALTEGPLVVERPHTEFDSLRPGQSVDEQFDGEDELITEAWDRPSPFQLTWWHKSEIMSFRFHSIVDPKARDQRQLDALTYASQYSVAKFACAAADSDTVDVTLAGTTAPMETFAPDSDTSESDLFIGLEYTLMSGSRERLETLLDHPEGTFLRPDERGTDLSDRYRRAFLAYLRAERSRGWASSPQTGEGHIDPEVKEELDGALEELTDPDAPPRMPSSAVLFSQLVAGDQEGFNLALADRLEKHRETFSVGHRANDSDGLINTHVLALACLAKAKGWQIRVESDYLPEGVLERAAVMFD